ncbi:hypothetical protein Patl1_35483 [Pistacia atlantica]|nr:hypothetical protein Patl1_35483 [Pistacia atlantica]
MSNTIGRSWDERHGTLVQFRCPSGTPKIKKKQKIKPTEDKASSDRPECLRWLDSKKPNSLLYVCFGSVFRFSAAQLAEIAAGLEASDSTFIWVYASNTEENKEWMPEGFEDRIEGKGLIIRECTHQLQLLEHEAVGGFMIH